VGTAKASVSRMPAGCFDAGPSWSPEGDRLVFSRECGDRSRLFVAARDGSNAVPISTGPRDSEPAWSPDGTTIAFVRWTGRGQLFTVNPDGGAVDRVLAKGSCFSPSWSPSGSSLAYETNRDGNVEMYVLSLATGTERRITRHGGDDWSPHWHPSA
jgi:Tol biopolymer transport system component